MYIVAAILAFSVLIIVHELGHFIMAKVNGVKVEEFSIGFGPRVIGVKVGETDYCLRILPLGGRVAMLGEEEEVNDKRSLTSKSPLRRISIIVAGVVMNYLLAIVIFITMGMNLGFSTPEVKDIVDNSPAKEVGLKAGDKFTKINDMKILTAEDVSVAVALAKGNPLDVEINRNNETRKFNITPKLTEEGTYQIGFYFGRVDNPSFTQSIKYGANQTVSLVKQTFLGFKMLFSGKANLKTDIGGPVTIVRMSGEAAKAGIWSLLYFTAFISVNLAVFNLLPFPALDGGWAFFILIELITGKKIPDRILNYVNSVALTLLLGIMILVTIKDILFPVQF
ncbi:MULTISPECIES: RIP metalloprotease RseP [Clostridium]|uniref:Zinc metalloprotease n=1 Tax=Clostridium intestinale DSM 6191 TaxID=1121320 RepID=A0A1M5TRX3_9CLOT|nr:MULTISPECIES: RIP metalloprotease RseP [Clostridium]SHH53431.1 regulator of sigma E protease [Clostridium intestinale DSM 6191]